MSHSKRNILLTAFALCSVSFFSCDHFSKTGDKSVVQEAPDSTAKKVEEEKTYDIALVNNKKDPTCGMPVTAGIHDTAHYKDKVIGFCSAECKADFVKNPEEGMKTAELK